MKKIERVTEFLEWEQEVGWTGSKIGKQDRAKLIGWISRVCDYYQCSRQTFHYACDYLDRVSVCPIPREKLQLVTVGCMMIAFKLEEEECPSIAEWQALTENLYSVQEIAKIELLILGMLNWRLYLPTFSSLLQVLDQEESVAELIDSALKTGINVRPSLLACAALSTVLGNKKALELIPVDPKAMLSCKLQISRRKR